VRKKVRITFRGAARKFGSSTSRAEADIEKMGLYCSGEALRHPKSVFYV